MSGMPTRAARTVTTPERGNAARELRAFVVLTVVLVFGALSILKLYPNTDIGWLVHAGERILDGSSLYVDIIEIHPPMLFWMSAQVVRVARIFEIHPLTAFDLFVIGHVVVGVLLARRITRGWRAPAALALVGIPLVGIDSGEPEHLFVLAFIPYMLLTERRLGRLDVVTWLALATGVLTGLAICRKPHLGLGWLVVEIAFVHAAGARAALRRPELATVIVVGVIYLALVMVATPEYFTIVRHVAAAYGDYYPARVIDLIANPRSVGVLLGLALLFAVDRQRDALITAATSLALLGAVFVQGHGWSYHFYPALAVAIFGVCTRVLKWRWSAPPLIAIAAAAMLWTNLWFYDLRPWPYHLPWLREVVRDHGGPVLALTTLMQPVYPLLTIERVQPVSRFASLWPIPQAYSGGGDPYPYNPPERMDSLERFAFDVTVTDFVRFKPKLVVVDTLPPRLWPPDRAMRGWSWLDYLGQDARFERDFRENYYEIPSISNYRLFVRRSPRGSVFPGS